ncbi:gag-pol poly protein [Trichonephila inaurata madagascariensis]|uniref:Gag-pol poly protein n=1 Tax=Trichonephila inaurata madagascariensis TaxID=2747483 RepID=A0A8X6YAU8_9ARAC|nr:gag-pol poly protein [Trichonephila inaurata madagascariensis]
MNFSRLIKPLTGETDWPTWKQKVLDYYEGAIEVIDGKLKRPESIDGVHKNLRKQHQDSCYLYRKANSYANSMIASTGPDAEYQKKLPSL